MLIDNIKSSIKQMKRLESLETADLDAKKKEKNDQDFKLVVNEFSKAVDRVDLANQSIGFVPSDETVRNLKDGIVILEGVVELGTVDEKECQDAKQHLAKKVTPILSKEWKSFYQDKTQGLGNKLATVRGLIRDKERVSLLSDAISEGSDWNTIEEKNEDGKIKCQVLAEAIYDVEHIEDELNLDESIKSFLIKVMKGQARISDVNDHIASWITQENLQDMFLISFSE